MKVSVLVPLVLLAPVSAWAAAPSFNCGKARSTVEKMVCNSDALSKLDAKLDQIYTAALKEMTAADRAAEKRLQKRWLSERDACAGQEHAENCASSRYEARIAQLQIKAGQVLVPAASPYDCPRSGSVTAYFYTEAQVPLAVLTIGKGKPVYATLAPSGSGAKYVADGVEFWSKDDAAILSVKGRPDEQCAAKAIDR
ncbi:uncharacterized protein DFR29_104385 [Tahibacter aquaticus]|uniref:C-type lysozyme inhibitor domain-containing protein n=1 Tax=Tahibacter aquaticus TaxID=520092 RepID=A0A4R6Z2U9_9GAMM|nr:MliC family protein [Tahibacter aquaticus]TDR45948.1 uncharacterized protein DFR29_104385 [Tahibacter aquaticus]